jgi:molybdenum cofactor biosynthesis enzyme MoaA
MPDIAVWPQCNIRCVFCSNPVEGYRDTERKYFYPEFKKHWEEYKAGQKTYLKFDGVRDFFSLTGGEPTIHPEFLRILATLRKDQPSKRIKLLTNGRMLFYPDFARRCLEIAGVPFEVAVPMFGYDARTHESISRTAGSFEQTVTGIENLFRYRRPGQKVEVRIIVHRIQVRWLDGLLRFLGERFPMLDSLDFLFVELEGFAERYAAVLKMPMREAALRIAENLPILRRFRQFRLLHFPLCAVSRELWPYVWNTLDPLKVEFPPACGSCRCRKDCVGIHKSYLKHMGPGEFHPVRRRSGVLWSGTWYHPVLGMEETCS